MTRVKRNYYYSVPLGEAFLKIKVLHRKFSVLNTLKDNWQPIAEELQVIDKIYPNKFIKGKLSLATKLPIIYVMHLKDLIKLKCNQVLPAHMVTEVVFVKATIDTSSINSYHPA